MPNPVLHQLPLHVEGLAALVTGEDLIGRVRLLVLLQITEVAKPSTTDVTQVRLFSRVDNDVALDVPGGCKPLPADLADVWLFPGMST